MGRSNGTASDHHDPHVPHQEAQPPLAQRLGAMFLLPDDLRALRLGGKPKLTARQMLTLRGLIAGRKEAEIAAILGRTPRAVKAHIQGIYQRYNCGKNPRPHQILAKAIELMAEGRAKRAREGGG